MPTQNSTLTGLQYTAAPLNPAYEAIPTGAPYTLVATDNGKVKGVVDTTDQVINLTSAVSGLYFFVQWQAGAGIPTLDPGAGCTINGSTSNLVGSQAAGSWFIVPTGANAWVVVGVAGDLTSLDMTDGTSFGRALFTAASVAAQRTALGLVIGTDVQAFNAYLEKLTAATPREITGAATLGATDVDCVLRFNSGSTAALTLANDATLTPIVGKSTIAVFIQGAGVPTIAAGTATLVGSPRSGLAQNDTIVLVHTGIANTWAYA